MSHQPYAGTPPTTPPSEERNLAVAAHVGALVTAWFALGLIAPLIVYLVSDNKPFARRHAAESLNFQILMLVATVVGSIIAVVVFVLTIGLGIFIVIPVFVIVALLALVFVIQASIAANRGEDYRYPFNWRLIS